MGNLHEGHLELVRVAATKADRVVVSIFVNPTQFGPDEDFDHYPSTLNEDKKSLQDLSVDVLFAPTVDVMYPQGANAATRVEVPEVSQGMCGDFRPGHFTGVATVVTRLFNLLQPDVAIFGEKDYQQLAVIRRMVADLGWPLQVLGVPTVREESGLAKSSRNQYLSETDRLIAPKLYKTLNDVRDKIGNGNSQYSQLERDAMQQLSEQGFRPEYVSIRNASSLQPPGDDPQELVILAAGWLGTTRLIDNLRV